MLCAVVMLQNLINKGRAIILSTEEHIISYSGAVIMITHSLRDHHPVIVMNSNWTNTACIIKEHVPVMRCLNRNCTLFLDLDETQGSFQPIPALPDLLLFITL
jgi:hypothetical protein